MKSKTKASLTDHDACRPVAGGARVENLYRTQIRQRIAAKTVSPEQTQAREQLRAGRVHKKADAISNAERDVPIRARFHAWMERAGFGAMQVPMPGQSYSGSHMDTLWEAYVDATLQERGVE